MHRELQCAGLTVSDKLNSSTVFGSHRRAIVSLALRENVEKSQNGTFEV